MTGSSPTRPIRAGKQVIYALFAEAKNYLAPGGTLALVIRTQQGAKSAERYLRGIYESVETLDVSGGYRVLTARKRLNRANPLGRCPKIYIYYAGGQHETEPSGTGHLRHGGMGLEQIIVSAPASVFYLTGTWVRPGERMLALYVTQSGEARLFANRLFALSGSVDAPLSEFDDTEDPIALLSQSVRPGTLGIDKSWPSHFTLRLMEAREDVRCVVGSARWTTRACARDEEEAALMRESSLKNDQAIVTAMGAIRAGAKESDVGAAYDRAAAALGRRATASPR